MKLSTLCWAIVPGIGQIHSGRAGKGLLYFALFALVLNAYFVTPFLFYDRVLRSSLLATSVLLWMASLVDYLRLSCEEEIAAEGSRRE
jgi:hypothetical protein